MNADFLLAKPLFIIDYSTVLAFWIAHTYEVQSEVGI
jgi:hypothetical protein